MGGSTYTCIYTAKIQLQYLYVLSAGKHDIMSNRLNTSIPRRFVTGTIWSIVGSEVYFMANLHFYVIHAVIALQTLLKLWHHIYW